MERITSTNRGFPLVREEGVEPPPFSTAPDFAADNLWAWWVDRPGMLTFVPARGKLMHKDCLALIKHFSFPRICEKFPNAEKLYFLHHFGNGDGYETQARIAMVEWGKTIPHRINGGAEIQISSTASALVRMGLATAGTALAMTGRRLDVVPSITAFCHENNIGPVAPGPRPEIR